MRNRFDAYYLPTVWPEYVEKLDMLPEDTVGGMLDLSDKGLTDADVPELVAYLNAHPEIKIVFLTKNQIGSNATLFLQCHHLKTLLLYLNKLTATEALALMKHPNIQTLGLGLNTLQGLTATIIASVREAMPDLAPEQALAYFVSELKLRFLDLSHFIGIEEPANEALRQHEMPLIRALGVHGNHLLTHLLLSGCPLDESEVRALAANQFFKHLGLTATNMTEAAFHHFAGNQTLSCLEVSANGFTLSSLRDCLSMPKLTSLAISENNLGDAGANEIAIAIENKRSALTELQIASCGLTLDGLIRLLRVKQLHTLSVGNHPAMVEMERLVPVLMAADHLQDLDVSGIPLGDNEIVPILGSIENLHHLNVSGCELPAVSIRALVEAINIRKHRLKELDVGINEFGDEGALELARLNKVDVLLAEECKITDVGATALANANPDSFIGFRLDCNLITSNGKRAFLNKEHLSVLQIKDEERGEQLHDNEGENEAALEAAFGNGLALDHSIDIDMDDLDLDADRQAMNQHVNELGPKNLQREWSAKRVDEFQMLLRIMALLGEQTNLPHLPKDIIKLIGFMLLEGLRSNSFVGQTLHLLVDNYKKPQWEKQIADRNGNVIQIFRKRPQTSITMFSLFEPLRVQNGIIQDVTKNRGQVSP